MNKASKEALYKACLNYAQSRVDNANTALEETQNSTNQETRSTAGDKHDTARAMMHIESERLSKQLADAQRLRRNIKSVDITGKHTQIKSGSLVKTDAGTFFLAISIGKLEVEDLSYFVISPGSPMGQVLIGAKLNDVVIFNGKSIKIRDIC